MAEVGLLPRGAIKRLKLKDFMSFIGTLVLETGSKVNLIEGPNGGGKSSLVAALCLGLGGNMKELGRQKRADELIRRGAPAFETEITLSGGPNQPDVIVHRRTEWSSGAKRRRVAGGSGGGSIVDSSEDSEDEDGDGATGRGSGRSSHTTWHINGRPAIEKRVKELITSMGIHFDNLCQFLPQERVAVFSVMNATELLERTEQAIGDGHLLQQHKTLKHLSGQLQAKREELQRAHDRLGRVEAEQAANAPEYKRLQLRNALRREVEQLRGKLVWVDKELCAAQLARAREQVATVQGRVDEARQQYARAQAPLNNRTRALQDLQRAVAAQLQEVQALDGRVGTGLGALRRLEQLIKAKEDELDGLKGQSTRWRGEVMRTRLELDRVRAERAALPTGLSLHQTRRLAEVDQEIQQASAEVGPIELQLAQKRQEIEQLAAQNRRLEEAEQRRQDRHEQRLRKLERQLPLSRRLYEWITEMRNAGRFRRRVLGPLLMEITGVANLTWAAQVEFVVGSTNLGAVVTEDRHDNNMVHEWIEANRRHGRPNRVIFMERSPGPINYPAGHPSQYQKYDITHTVDQVFEATSDLVKQALCVCSGINSAYVGTDRTERPEVMSELLELTPVRRVLTPRLVTLVSESEYDRTYRSQKILDLPRAQLLNDGAAQGDEEAERQHLEARRQAKVTVEAEAQLLVDNIQQRQTALCALRAEKTHLQNERMRLEKSAMELSRRELDLARRLDRLHQEGDPLTTVAALRTGLCSVAELMLQQARNTAALIAEQHQNHRQIAANELTLAAASASLAPLQQAVRRAEEGVQAAEREVAAVAQQERCAQERLRDAEAQVQEELGGNGRPDAALQFAWAQLPDQLVELEELLKSKQAEMEQAHAALRGDEASVMEAWRQREAEITDLHKTTTAGRTDVQALEADIATRKAAWLPELQRHMEAISEALKRNFASIGCAGEVVLAEGGDDFGKYTAEIRVQYRPDEAMRSLDGNQHSGGERSVATMLYVMALQGVTATPFRVVDEINQGMDSCNEHKVFNMLVESSSCPDTPQMLLLTPKLIPDLHYNDHVRVLSVKVIPAANISVSPSAAALLATEPGEHAGAAAGAAVGGSGGSRTATAATAAASHRFQQQQPAEGAVPGQVHLDWQNRKHLLLFGRSPQVGRGPD